ncbi:hypothetical protein Mgra_00006385 [Meloidogyne graminicola]|uniref:Uncharacterized protein n=1 Tax=Meloidogyne graminicola TaxID=189291 RepID=A0A8S9ZM81_9BILA|nr:hypothetical protein Mgra_00006385 [Meloidogyne graminicola]
MFFYKNFISINFTIFLILFLLYTPFGLCKKSQNIFKRNFLFPRFLLKNENGQQIEQQKKIIARSIDEPIDVLDNEIFEDNNEGDQSVIEINENILKSVIKPSSPSRRPCYFSPIQCLLHSPDHNRKFENYPEFQHNPRSFRTSKLFKMDEILPKLNEEINLETINSTTKLNKKEEEEEQNNNNKLYSSLFIKIENGKQQNFNTNIPNLKAAFEKLLRNSQQEGGKIKTKTRRILRQSNNNLENNDLINNNNNEQIKKEGKINKFYSNPFRRSTSNSWLRGL